MPLWQPASVILIPELYISIVFHDMKRINSLSDILRDSTAETADNRF